MNYFKNVKWHFYLLEGLSLLVLLWTICNLFYNFGYINFSSGSNKENQMIIGVNFTSDLIPSISNFDLQLNIKKIKLDTCPDVPIPRDQSLNGYFILNKKYINIKDDDDQMIFQLNKLGLESCYIYKDCEAARRGKGIFLELKNNTSDFFNLIIFIFLCVFLIFIRINIYKLHKKTFRIIQKQTAEVPLLFIKKYIYSFIVFNFSILFIVPYLYSNLYDLSLAHCYGFPNNYFNSYFFDRKFLYEKEISELNVYTEIYHEKFRNNDIFFLHNSSILKELSQSSYVKNILFLTLMVWLAGSTDVLNKPGNTPWDSQESTNKSKSKIGIYLFNLIIYTIWLIYLFYGIVNYFDDFEYFHRLIFYNFSNILNWKVMHFFISNYVNLYFYAYIITYSFLVNFAKNNKQETPSDFKMDFRKDNSIPFLDNGVFTGSNLNAESDFSRGRLEDSTILPVRNQSINEQ